jgi:hypothetical protein
MIPANFKADLATAIRRWIYVQIGEPQRLPGKIATPKLSL